MENAYLSQPDGVTVTASWSGLIMAPYDELYVIDTFHLVLGGLVFDIAGAILITLPDIPKLREYLWSYRVRRAIEQMELSGVHPYRTGYEELSEILEDIYGLEVPKDIAGLRVGFQNISKFSPRVIYVVYEMEGEGTPLGDLGYESTRHILYNRIREHEARIRAGGFILLITGIGLQATGLFLNSG